GMTHDRAECVAHAVDRPIARIELPLAGAAAGIADHGSGDRGHRPRCATEGLSVDHEPVHFEARLSGREVLPGTAGSDGPRKRSTADLADRIVDVRLGIRRAIVGSGDHPYDA